MNKYFEAIEIEINSQCNRKCWYCPNLNYKRKEQGEMEPALFEKLLNQLSDIDYSGRVSYHFYGEPLLCSNLDKFIEMTRQKLPKSFIKLYTNGDFLSEKRIIELLEKGADYFSVSEHADVSNRFFKEEYNNLSNELKDKIYYINCSENLQYFSNRGGLVSAGIERDYSKEPCTHPEKLLIVTLKGNVVPCCEDFYQLDSMGNISENHIIDIWNSEKYVRFRGALASGFRRISKVCTKCNIPERAWQNENSPNAPPIHIK